MPGNSHFMAALGRAGDGGSVVETMDDMLNKVVDAVYRTGNKGTVTLKVELKPNGKNGRGFEVTWDTKCSIPSPQHGKSFAYADENNNLTRTPPADEMQEAFSTVDGGKS